MLQITVSCIARAVPAIEEILETVLGDDAAAISSFEHVDETGPDRPDRPDRNTNISAQPLIDDPDSPWDINCITIAEPDRDHLVAAIASILQPIGAPPFNLIIDELPQRDWVSESLVGLEAVCAGRFVTYGPHETPPLPGGRIPLQIGAGRAFGTGHHETTAGCLAAISLLDRTSGKVATIPQTGPILDLGCGAGILAIAMAKIWPRAGRIIASDIDPAAAAVTSYNAKANKVAQRVRPLAATGFRHRDIRRAGPYRLIAANILANPLCELAAEMRRHTAPGSLIILSGLLDYQQQRLLARYRAQGFILRHRLVFGTRSSSGVWPTLIMERR